MQPGARRLLLRLLMRPVGSTPGAAQQRQQQLVQRQLAVAARDAAAQPPQLQQQVSLLRQLHRHPWPLAPALAWHGSSCCRHHSSIAPAGGDGSGGDGSSGAARRDLAIVFTCGRCETRAAKTFSRQAYEAGVVLVTCPGCQAMHLIADHLGWFGDSGFKIDEHLQQQGQQVKRVALDGQEQAAAELTAEDLAGWSKVQQLLTTVAAAASGSDSQSSAGGGCSGGSSSQAAGAPDDADDAATDSASSSSEGGSAAAAAAAAEAAASEGVVQVAPGDVEAWLRVQQQQQEQGRT